MTAARRTIAIVGGGCSGTLVAVELLRRALRDPTRIVLIERDGQPGRGVAFRQRQHPYLLNVPASRMSANPAVPDEFLEFARQRDPTVSPHDFLPRALFGDYLQALLVKASQAASPGVRLEVRNAEVAGIAAGGEPGTPELVLSNGSRLAADTVVLATGHLRPRRLPGLHSVEGHPRVISDPWGVAPDYRPHERVLVLGSGLTMADVATAAASVEPTVRLWALSRRGLVPRTQVEPRPEFHGGRAARARLESADSARVLLRTVREIAAAATVSGGDWRDAIQLARQLAPPLWHRSSVDERRRFLRHLRPFWDAHRHRLAPAVSTRLKAMIADGRLTITAGRLRACAAEGAQLAVRWRPRGARADRLDRVDRIVNATGPETDIARGSEPLWTALLSTGRVVTDPLGLGIRTGAHGAFLDSSDVASDTLYYVGPLLRADHWEATAVHELSARVQALAWHLTDAPGTR